MVKIYNKIAIIGAILALIPIALPYVILDTTIQATLENVIVYVFPWGLISVNGFAFQDIMMLINFMIPLIGAPAIAIYGATKKLGGKTLIGLAGVLSIFASVIWGIMLGPSLPPQTVDVPGVGLVDTVGYFSFGFYLSIIAGIVLLIAVFLHPRPEEILDEKSKVEWDITAPYELDEVVKTEDGEEYIFCPYCGEKIPRASEFCPKCGTKLQDITTNRKDVEEKKEINDKDETKQI
ncbi:MAG: zinc-ribbon domain-containing protein [Candidatus Odinarchaeia archaeon]